MTCLAAFVPGTAGSALGWTALCAILPGVFLVAWTALVLSLINYQRPNLRYGVALGSLVLVVLFPILQFIWLNREVPTENPVQERTIQAIAHKLQDGPTPLDAMSQPTRMLFALQHAAGSLLPWALLTWGIGSSLLCLRLAGGWLHLKRWVGAETGPAPAELQSLLAALAARMGLRRPVLIAVSDRPGLPATIGWRRPVILVSADLLPRLDAAYLESILSHELAHVRRADYVVNLLQALAEALFFWNPAVWLASQQVRMERESCCDAEGVRVKGDALRYAEALARLEQLRVPAQGLVVALCGSNLVVRLRRLLELEFRSRRTMTPWSAAGILLLVVAGCCVGSLSSIWIAAKQRKASQDYEGWRAVTTTHQLFAMLHGRTPSLEPEVGGILRSTRDTRWLMVLLAALRSNDAETREEAAWALGLLGDIRAVSYLSALRNDASPAVRTAVTDALARLR